MDYTLPKGEMQMTFTQDELAIIIDALEHHCCELRRMEKSARSYGGVAYANKLDKFAMCCIHVHAKVRNLFNEGVLDCGK